MNNTNRFFGNVKSVPKHTQWMVLGIALVTVAMLVYLLKNDCLKELYHISGRTAVIIVAAGAVVMCVFAAMTSIVRYKLFYASTLDLGIAGQLFYYMRGTFRQLTTCERNALVSHFAVHFTPT